jgi:hypothetical protein
MSALGNADDASVSDRETFMSVPVHSRRQALVDAFRGTAKSTPYCSPENGQASSKLGGAQHHDTEEQNGTTEQSPGADALAQDQHAE